MDSENKVELINKGKEYSHTYYLVHKNDKYHCNHCNKDYSIFHRDQHSKTAKHIRNKAENEKTIIKINDQNVNDKYSKIIALALGAGLKIEIKDNKLTIE